MKKLFLFFLFFNLSASWADIDSYSPSQATSYAIPGLGIQVIVREVIPLEKEGAEVKEKPREWLISIYQPGQKPRWEWQGKPEMAKRLIAAVASLATAVLLAIVFMAFLAARVIRRRIKKSRAALMALLRAFKARRAAGRTTN